MRRAGPGGDCRNARALSLRRLWQGIESGIILKRRTPTSRKRAGGRPVLPKLLRAFSTAIAHGLFAKTIAHDLGIALRTVEFHRADLLAKLAVPSLSTATRIAFAAGLGGAEGREHESWRPLSVARFRKLPKYVRQRGSRHKSDASYALSHKAA